jgi:prepilin-type N-terminal cleavage/methylation domain-containing protein
MKGDIVKRFRSNRGFSLLEIVVGLCVMAVLAAVAVPMYGNWLAYDKPRRAIRGLLGDLNRARGYAVSGQRPDPVASGWPANDRTLSAGVMISAANQYSIFLDRNGITDGDEYTIAIITLPAGLTITHPTTTGAMVRFLQDGTTGAPTDYFEISDVTRQISRKVTVSGAGLAWLD